MISVQRPTSTSRFKVQTKFKFCRRFEVKVKVRSRGGQAQVQRQCRTPDSANVHGQVQAQVLALVRVLLLTQVQTHARVAPEKRREYQYGVGGVPQVFPLGQESKELPQYYLSASGRDPSVGAGYPSRDKREGGTIPQTC